MAYSHGKKIRLISFKGYYNQLIYEIQELILPGEELDMQGWWPRNRPCNEGDYEEAIKLFDHYLKKGIPHPPWPVNYINSYCDAVVLQEGVVKKKSVNLMDVAPINDDLFLLAA